MKSFLAVIGLSLLVLGAAGQKTKYGVTVVAKDNVDFSKFATYAWTEGRPSSDKVIHAQVITSVDRELTKVGLSKVESGAPDVLVTYASLTRTDVDLKAKPDAQGKRPEYSVGTLVVRMLDPASRVALLELRVDQPVEIDREKLTASIDGAVAALFEKYPTRRKK
jgi:hypothetical protein